MSVTMRQHMRVPMQQGTCLTTCAWQFKPLVRAFPFVLECLYVYLCACAQLQCEQKTDSEARETNLNAESD